MELIGFVVSAPAFELAKSAYRGDVFASDLLQLEGKIVRIVADLVTDKSVKTKRGDYMKFRTFLDSKGDFIDTVHFSQSFGRYPLRGPGPFIWLREKLSLNMGTRLLKYTNVAKCL
ncbi:hypothetical protein ATB96_17660 [Elizabethkingia ursingii]|nr:hypothetical protein ATB96_17660 [Elizabethkingia ursingii]